MRFFICGPIASVSSLKRDLFHQAERELREAGHEAFNPWSLGLPEDMEKRRQCAARCLRELLASDAVVMLPDWERSRGARLEVEVANAIGLPVHDWVVWHP